MMPVVFESFMLRGQESDVGSGNRTKMIHRVKLIHSAKRLTSAAQGCLSWLVCAALIAACGQGENDPEPSRSEPPAEAREAGAHSVESLPDEQRLEKFVSAAPTAGGQDDKIRPDTQRVSVNASELLAELESLTGANHDLDSPKVAHLLQALRQKGVGAVIPIRDFLLDARERNDMPESLRQHLLDLLLSLQLPEVEAVALELLGSEPLPSETWRLGRYLERADPAKYSALVLAAAEQTLVDADPAAVLPAEIYQLLGDLGGEETASLLASLPAHREAYASLALAALPDGSGLPALERNARQFLHGRDTVAGRLAVQLLAQEAPRFPQAAAALIELAESGSIPHDLWPYLLDIVAGNWELSLEPYSGEIIGSHTYNRPEGSQVIFRVVPSSNGIVEGLQAQRVYLLDRLLLLAPSTLG